MTRICETSLYAALKNMSEEQRELVDVVILKRAITQINEWTELEKRLDKTLQPGRFHSFFQSALDKEGVDQTMVEAKSHRSAIAHYYAIRKKQKQVAAAD